MSPAFEGGAPLGCPSTPYTRSVSSARSPRDISPSSSDAPPGVRTSGWSGRPSRSPACTTRPPTTWTLYWRDRNLRLHVYDLLTPSDRIDDVLAEIDRDPTCIFWG